jgi:hypothetical protein
MQQPEDETSDNTQSPIRLFLEKILTTLLRKQVSTRERANTDDGKDKENNVNCNFEE